MSTKDKPEGVAHGMSDENLIASLRAIFRTPRDKIDSNTLAIVARVAANRLEALSPSRLQSANEGGVIKAHVHRLIAAGDQFAAFDQHMTEKHDEASALWVSTRKEWDKRRADAQRAALSTKPEGVALDGPELFEIAFGVFQGDVPDALTDEKLSSIASAINSAFLTQPPTPAPVASRDQMEVVAWRHPSAGWAHHDKNVIRNHCLKDGLDGGPQPLVTLDAAQKAIAERDEYAAALKAAGKTAQHNIARAETAEARVADLEKALTQIAEGNLGDHPWQANYERIRQVAVAALHPEREG